MSEPATSGQRQPADRSLPAEVLGAELLSWLDQAGAVLRASPWAPALGDAGLDVWDAAFNPLYLRLLALARNDDARRVERLDRRRLWGALRRRLDALAAHRHSARPQRVDLVFWPREPTHVASQLPVASELVRRGRRCLFVTSPPSLFGLLHARGAKVLHPASVWRRDLAAARRQGQQAATATERDPGVELPAASGFAAGEALGVLGRELAVQGPEVAVAEAAAEAVLDRLAPRLLVVGNDLTLEGRVATRVAQRRGIATAAIMHGLLAREAIESRHVVDRFLLFGRGSHELLVEIGLPPGRLVVTGSPQLEAQLAASTAAQRGTRSAVIDRRLGLRSARPRFLVATSGAGHSVSQQHHREFIAALGKVAASHPQADFLIKLHRKDRPELYAELGDRARAPNVRIVAGRSDLPASILDWIAGSTAVITAASTVALEAMVLGVPVITVDLRGELGGLELITSGATLHATRPSDFESAVQHLCRSHRLPAEMADAARELVERTFDSPVQGAACRAANELERSLEALAP